MNNCNCNQGCGCNHGAGVVAGPCVSRNCGKSNENLRIKTVVLQPSLGTDAKGQPYAPKLGAHTNTIVTYQANNAVYFYDSRGIYTSLSGAEGNDYATQINALVAEDQRLNQAIVDTATMLQTNINEEVNARESDRDNLQTNINAVANQLAEKQDTLISGTNIKTINGASILGEGDMTIAGGGADYLYQYTLSADNLNQLLYNVTTDSSVVIRGNVVEKGDEESGANISLTTLPVATSLKAGVMSAADKAKLDGLSASTNLTSVPTASYTADNVNLAFGDDTVELTPAVGTAGGAVSKSGIMSAFQASQLAALAEAYEAEEKGTILYEGTASVNNIELSESGLNYDHLIIVAQYMGMGSFALEQQVSEVFYPTDSVKAFQMNATDITTGNTPTVELIQDIWSITDEGDELELSSALKATVNSETSVTPDTTSHFIITKVVGFGKKSVIQS